MPSHLSPNEELGGRASIPIDTRKSQKAPGGWPTGHTARNESFRNSLTRDLLSCFNPRRNQADVVHLGLMAEVDDLGDLAEVEVLVALDEHDLLLTGCKDLRQLGLEVCFCERCFVDQIRRRSCSIRPHLHDDRTRVLRLFLMLLRRLRNQCLQPSRRHRNDDHEDNQQHQKNVDKRRYIHVRHRSAGTSSTHSHSNLLKSVGRSSDCESASCQISLITVSQALWLRRCHPLSP